MIVPRDETILRKGLVVKNNTTTTSMEGANQGGQVLRRLMDCVDEGFHSF